MKEIEKLFQTAKVEEIKKLLKVIIEKIETVDRQKQEVLIEEIKQNVKKTEKELRKNYTPLEGLSIFPEEVAPLALLVEEISNDIDNNEDILKVLKFNLNNYFEEFKEVKKGDWHVEIEELKRVILTLQLECKYFNILQKKDLHLSIMMFHNQFRRNSMSVLNYSTVKNKNFAIHSYYCSNSKNNRETVSEICLQQFGYILKEIVVGGSQRAPDGFIELFEDIDMPEIDDESKELTALFANTFKHYIIEKMEIRVKQEEKDAKIEHLDTRNEQFVEKMLRYFDNMFEKLLEDKKELDDNAKCLCGSGKKYKNCCKKRKLKYYEGKDKKHYIKSVPKHPYVEQAIENERIRFKRVFGRTPGKEDYVCGGVLLRDLERAYKIMKRQQMADEALLYATHKTGRMLTTFNEELLPEREVEEFKGYVQEYRKLIKSKIKGHKWNILQAVATTNFILENQLQVELPNMIYALNLCVNFYSQNTKENEQFIIHNIKDFLVFCAYKASIQLTVLHELVNGEYYENSVATIRIIYEILTAIRAYKQNPELFEEKILSVVGLQLGSHRKLENGNVIEDIQTGKRYKYNIQKRQLAEKAGKDYERLYDIWYSELSGFAHLDTETAKDMFQNKDAFEEIDECLMAGFLGMILGLEIIIELMEFEGSDKKVSKDLKYFSNILLKDFLDIMPTVISIENKEVYHILSNTLEAYKTDYKINYQRSRICEVY